MTIAPAIVNRQMNRAERAERLQLRHVREHRKYHFLVDSSTSTSNDTTANNDDDTTATSFTTVTTSDNDNGEEIMFITSTGSNDPEPIFAVPRVCVCSTAAGIVLNEQDLNSRKGSSATSGRCSYRDSTASSLHIPSSNVSSVHSGGGGGGLPQNTNFPLGSRQYVRDFKDGVFDRRTSSSTSPTPTNRSRNPAGAASEKSSITYIHAENTTPTTTITTSSASPTTTTTTTTSATTANSPSDSEDTEKGVSPILLLWSLLTVLVAGTCTFAFLQPFWVMHVDLVHTFGMVSYCFMETQTERTREVCSAYGGYHHLANIPSGAWQAGCVLYGAGCVLLCVSSFLALSNLGMANKHIQRVSLVAGYLQAIAVLIMIAGLLIFPLGFGSTFFRHYCGDFASAYDTGHCLIGWSYMLGIMGTALSVFCPFLSQFTDMRARDIFS